jgi:hypothetical protein
MGKFCVEPLRVDLGEFQRLIKWCLFKYFFYLEINSEKNSSHSLFLFTILVIRNLKKLTVNIEHI